jgi:hypothetical protein
LLRKYNEDDVKRIVFTDESVFPLSGYHNSQNHRVYAVQKSDVREELVMEKQQFPRTVMVWAGASSKGKLPLIFCEDGCKINAHNYRDDILGKVIPKANRLHRGDWILQQDSAPSHRAHSTQSYIKENVPAFIPAEKWPPCSPDLNPMDYSIWGILKEKVYARHFKTVEEMKEVIQDEYDALDMGQIGRATAQWRTRLGLVVRNEGGHFEH